MGPSRIIGLLTTHVVSPRIPFDGTMTVLSWKCLTAKFNVLSLLRNASRSLERSPQMFAISTHLPFDLQRYHRYIAVSYSNNNEMYSPHDLIEACILKSEDMLAVDQQ